MRSHAIVSLAFTIVACGNDRESSRAGSPSTSSPPPTTGTVRGICRYVGTRTPTRLGPIAAMGCEVEHDDESLREDATHALADCVVWIDDAWVPPDVGAVVEDPPEMLFVVEPCGYVPHVAAVVGPVRVAFDNRAKGDVNVHGYRDSLANTVFNAAVTKGTVSRGLSSYELGTAGTYLIRSDMRPPYLAWLHVFGHPWFDVTTLRPRGEVSAGAFEIREVPAGERSVVCWHELVGREVDPRMSGRVGPDSLRPDSRILRRVHVEPGRVATVEFEVHGDGRNEGIR